MREGEKIKSSRMTSGYFHKWQANPFLTSTGEK